MHYPRGLMFRKQGRALPWMKMDGGISGLVEISTALRDCNAGIILNGNNLVVLM
jgi:hypothetical protein